MPNGELRRQVAAFLADRPGDEFTPGAVARGLSDRSSGAVANALAALTSAGAAQQTTTKPDRYRATATTATAATPATGSPAAPAAVPAPAPPAAASAGPARRKKSGPAAPAGSPAARTGAGATAAAGGAGSAGEPVSGPVLRPNGQAYHPRLLAHLPDVTALRRLREAGVPALLYGPPGTGKTSVVEAAFGDLVTVAGDGDTAVADFVGEYTQTPDGRYVFVHGR